MNKIPAGSKPKPGADVIVSVRYYKNGKQVGAPQQVKVSKPSQPTRRAKR